MAGRLGRLAPCPMCPLVGFPPLPRLACQPTSAPFSPRPPACRRSSSSSSSIAPPPCSTSTATADLAVYQFAQRRAGATAEWFQAAVRDIVRHVDASPFLQTVQLGGGTAPPRFNTYGVHDSVVAAPEVSPLPWCGVVGCRLPARALAWAAAACASPRTPTSAHPRSLTPSPFLPPARFAAVARHCGAREPRLARRRHPGAASKPPGSRLPPGSHGGSRRSSGRPAAAAQKQH